MKKKLLAVLTTVMMAFSLFPSVVSAATAPTVKVDKPDVFTVGQTEEFSISTTGGSKAGTMVKGFSTVTGDTSIAKIEYYETADGNWYELTGDSFGPQSGFPLGDFTSKFRVTFTEAGSVNATIQIKAVDNDAVLAETTAEFKGVPAPHVHTPTEVKAKAATCTEDGNIAYWYCADCGKYFSDEALTKEISKDSIMIPATGEKPDKNETTDVPKTGDTGMLPWMLALLLSAGGFTVLGIKKKHAK
ncbi:MAG: LPXTG cell wall anchor domain-containing protein [Clostridiales bacterium]|nr:LPXTG cell wall anchor domain-containing protein [Clostridiales bacterium]